VRLTTVGPCGHPTPDVCALIARPDTGDARSCPLSGLTLKEKRPTDDSELHCLASKRRSVTGNSHRQAPYLRLAWFRCLVSSCRGRESGIWRHGPDGHRPVVRMWRGGSTNVHGFSDPQRQSFIAYRQTQQLAVDCICSFQLPTTASLNKPA
jgi:hypothetical protein